MTGKTMVLSKFESLPPELIVETSDYLDGCDLYSAFCGLNRRLDKILDEQCHRLHINFNRISKIKFDLFCNRILGKMSDRVVSLTLGGGNSSTPGQLELFLFRFSLSNIFVKLESFKLTDFTKSDVQIVLPHLRELTCLKCLSIVNFDLLSLSSVEIFDLFNENVQLPISLRSLAFPYEMSKEWIQISNSTASFVDQFHGGVIHMDSFPFLLRQFPFLKRLTGVVDGYQQIQSNHFERPIMFHSLKYFKVNIREQVMFEDFGWLLQSLSELQSLSVESVDPQLPFLEAHRWETVLPKDLVSFRFDLSVTQLNNPDPRELLKCFQSQFWLSRCWFVQCDLRDQGRYFRLSTVQSPIISILHWPDDEIRIDSTRKMIYSNVVQLRLWWNLSKSFQGKCPHVQSIHLYGAGNDQDQPIHPEISQILQNPSLKHLIIDTNLPIDETRFGSVLGKSSINVDHLTCSTSWLIYILEEKQCEWICVLLTMRIRKLNLLNDQISLTNTNLIGFSRTFINLKELTMKLESIDEFFFLLDILRELTTVKIEFPETVLVQINDLTQWIRQNSNLQDFIVEKRSTSWNTFKIILWIGSRRISNSLIKQNDFYLNYPFIHLRVHRT